MSDKPILAANLPPADTKPWWRSTTLQGLAVMLIMLALQKAQINVPGLDGDVTNFVADAFEAIGAGMVTVGRVKASKAITLGSTPTLGN